MVDARRLRMYRPYGRTSTGSLFARVSYQQRMELSRVFIALAQGRGGQ